MRGEQKGIESQSDIQSEQECAAYVNRGDFAFKVMEARSYTWGEKHILMWEPI